MPGPRKWRRNMARLQSTPKWIQIVVAAVVITGGLVTIGFTMPWDALSKAEAAEHYETKNDALEKQDRCFERYDGLQRSMDRIEAGQNRILDMLLGR